MHETAWNPGNQISLAQTSQNMRKGKCRSAHNTVVKCNTRLGVAPNGPTGYGQRDKGKFEEQGGWRAHRGNMATS